MLDMIRRAKSGQDGRAAAKDFATYARLVALAKGGAANLRGIIDGRVLPERVRNEILKAAPGTITGTSPGWGNTGYDTLADGFLSSPSHAAAFDIAFGSMRHAPLKSRVPTSSVAVVGAVVDEAAAKAIGELDLGDMALEPRKAAAIVVASNELLRLGGQIAEDLFDVELKIAVARATDANFLAGLIAGTTPEAASSDFLFDLASKLIGPLQAGADADIFVVAEPRVVRNIALTGSVAGMAFPGMTITGGSIAGVTLIGSDALDEGEVVAFDARAIAADRGTLTIDASRNATLDMAGGNSPGFDLWSRNAVALRAERWFGWKLLRSTAAASISGATYAADSP
jgi:hypothetical protein